ncbi:zinc finger protein CONSTANS-LIKE 3-like isoform X2 [Silene latifolia]|uniref:zinc finger protein CONSTANS-LIKE 3-like isoform X2 n=1 Tax=Silene latifolia TaxID=37657 RepID=UPI003D786DBA
MGVGIMGAKLCDSCKSSPATLYCRADTAYLCLSCDSNIHAANKLASRHSRVWVCEVCEQSPATVTCKADAAHLCPSCDRDIHSANPLARRHDRLPLVPFFDTPSANDNPNPNPNPNPNLDSDSSSAAVAAAAATSAAISKLFGDEYYSDSDDAEAASWLLANPKAAEEHKSIDFLFAGGPTEDQVDPYLDLDFAAHPKPDPSVDGVVPDPDPDHKDHHSSMYSLSSYNHNFDKNNTNGYDALLKHHTYPLSSFAAPQPSLSHSMSSSSIEYGVVPDANPMTDVGTAGVMEKQQMKMMGMDREARVLRYREKRKNRKFEKTIRYASRKAYAETRPRIKGRFAKRSDISQPTASVDGLFASDAGYGVVPSF